MIESFTAALIAFLVTIDPLGMVPLFLALTAGMSAAARSRTAFRGVLVGALILGAFALAGDGLLGALGISISAFRIAGGLMLLVIAFEMVFEKRAERRSQTVEHVRDERQPDPAAAAGPGAGGEEHVAVFPLAIPLIAGPGAITAVILQLGRHEGLVLDQLAVVGALVTVLALLLSLLLLASRIAHLLGRTLVNVLSRLLGVLLAALAIQFVIDGVREAFSLV
ncbi:MAG: MarC family protein [Geminicoccaceae bacterium]|nr:MarC family protein [Geminicoccaceae bacterium]